MSEILLRSAFQAVAVNNNYGDQLVGFKGAFAMFLETLPGRAYM